MNRGNLMNTTAAGPLNGFDLKLRYFPQLDIKVKCIEMFFSEGTDRRFPVTYHLVLPPLLRQTTSEL